MPFGRSYPPPPPRPPKPPGIVFLRPGGVIVTLRAAIDMLKQSWPGTVPLALAGAAPATRSS